MITGRKKAYQVVSDVHESSMCISCHGIYVDTIKLKNCEHAMCQSCFSRRSKNYVKVCPCSAILEQASLETTAKLRRSLEDISVLCPYRCGKTIKLGETSMHTESECPLAIIRCENKECYRKVKRKELSSHMNVCDFRIVSCEGCKRNLKFYDLRKHQISTGCINTKCKQTIVRGSRGSDRLLKHYISTIKQDTFKTMRAERSLEKKYMWRRIERNPDRYSPTLVQHSVVENQVLHSSPSPSIKALGSRESQLMVRSKEGETMSPDSQACKRCLKTYTFRTNHSEACLWHEGVRYSRLQVICLQLIPIFMSEYLVF